MLLAVLIVLLAMTLVMAAGWLFQRQAKNGGWTDVFWTYGTGAACALAALLPVSGGGPAWRRLLVAGLALVWSLRLGTYVALRVSRSAEDARYRELRREWGPRFDRNMLGLLLVQAPITAVLSVGVVLAARNPATSFRAADALGALILTAAMGGEALADAQMKRFKSDVSNRGAVCREGLWSWSRHPNYFFEALVWLAYPIIAFRSAAPLSALAFVSPILMFSVVRFMTGVPPLEKAMLASKGEAYRRYQEEVSPLLPRPPARGRTAAA